MKGQRCKDTLTNADGVAKINEWPALGRVRRQLQLFVMQAGASLLFCKPANWARIIAPFCASMLFAGITTKFNGHVSVGAAHKSAINVDKTRLSQLRVCVCQHLWLQLQLTSSSNDVPSSLSSQYPRDGFTTHRTSTMYVCGELSPSLYDLWFACQFVNLLAGAHKASFAPKTQMDIKGIFQREVSCALAESVVELNDIKKDFRMKMYL